MGFLSALQLVKWLEGPGRVDERYGVTQSTWKLLGFEGRVELATDMEIAVAYHRLWDSCKIRNPEANCEMSFFDILGEPADAVAFQCFTNLPWDTFHKLVQGVLGVSQDGMFGTNTYYAVMKLRPTDLADKILDAQRDHYRTTAKPEYLNGLLNRCSKVDMWLARKSPLAKNG